MPKISVTNKDQLLKKFAFQSKVRAVYAYLEYVKEGISQKLVQAVKYDHNKELGEWLGNEFGKSIKNSVYQLDVLIPLPLHVRRLRKRGFNQSEIICRGMETALGLPIDSDSLIRIKDTKTQTQKSKMMRWESMEQIFEVTNPSRVEGRHVLLVDDVVTTGATMGILCDEIARHNPASISIAALAAGK